MSNIEKFGLVPTDDEQSLALYALYESLQMHSSSSIDWWKTTNENVCTFSGIACNSKGDIVTLDLTGLSLEGTIPTEIGLFPKLERLGLGRNKIQGTLPTSISQLTNLRHLEVFKNQLTGSLPQDFSSFSKMKRILVQLNQFHGSLSSSICSLEKLHGLDLFGNPFSGSLPDCLEGRLKNLKLWDTQLTGTIPRALCDGRPINDLDPNPYGCKAIACPTHTYSSTQGRQTSETDICQPCPTALYLGSSTCPEPSAAPTMTASPRRSLEPTGRSFTERPTMVTLVPTRFPTRTPSSRPSVEPTIATSVPTNSPTMAPSPRWSLEPSEGSFTERPTIAATLIPTKSPTRAPRSRITTLPTFTATVSSPSLSTQSRPNHMPFSSTSQPSDQHPVPLERTIRPTTTPQKQPNFTSADWNLLGTVCVFSVLAMALVVLIRRTGRRWQQPEKQQNPMVEAAPSSKSMSKSLPLEHLSIESESGWNDDDSSSSYWQEECDQDFSEDDTWSNVYIPRSTSDAKLSGGYL